AAEVTKLFPFFLENPSLHHAAVGLSIAAWFIVVVRRSSWFVVLEGPPVRPTPASPGSAPPSSVRRVHRQLASVRGQLPVVCLQLASVRRQLPIVRGSPANLWSLPSQKDQHLSSEHYSPFNFTTYHGVSPPPEVQLPFAIR
ncbi:hypothetical protein S83_020027, partial [Arachis hypogaea]